jgi:hypothetical protein
MLSKGFERGGTPFQELLFPLLEKRGISKGESKRGEASLAIAIGSLRGAKPLLEISSPSP